MKSRKLTLQLTRRLIFVLLTVCAYLIQCTFLPRTGFPFPVMLMIPLLISVSMFEHEFPSLFFGLLTGALWDLASPLTDGFLALMFAFTACLIGLLSHYILRNTLLGALIITATVCVIFSLISELFIASSLNFQYFRQIFIEFYLPSSAITLLLTVPFYFIVRKIAVTFRGDKQQTEAKA